MTSGGKMRRVQVLFVVILTVMLSACAASAPRHMAFKDDAAINIFKIKPEVGKAALVVARTVSFGGAIEFDTYLDKKMIGVTQWKSHFIKTDVTPGVHYVISKAENYEPVKLNFEANHVYYLLQVPRLGVWRARISVAPIMPEQLSSTFDTSCRLVVYDPKKPGEDLSDDDYNGAVNDYEREVKEGHHSDHLSYKGVEVK